MNQIIRSRLLPKAYSGETEIRDLRRMSKNKHRNESSWIVVATTFNVGNHRVHDRQMSEWLGSCAGADVVAITLQEANYLSSSQKRGLTVLGASALALSAGMPVTAALAGVAVGAMAVHSHLMPRIRDMRKRREDCKNKVKENTTEDDEEDNDYQDEDDEDEERDSDDSSSYDDSEEDAESNNQNFRVKGSEGSPFFHLAILSALERQLEPRGFRRVVFVGHGQLRLVVYTNKNILLESSKSAKHGIGKVFNKGGLAARISLSSPKKPTLDIAFVGAHLPAHEGKRQERTEALNEIWTAIAPTIDGADVTILYGDLNYRLDFPQNHKSEQINKPSFSGQRIKWPPRSNKTNKTSSIATSSSSYFNQVCSLIAAGQLEILHRKDELLDELTGSSPAPVFAGFATPSCDFAPTFKLHRNKSRSYNEKRIPAWCDRILFKLRSGRAIARVDIVEYNSHEVVTSSDHKPVTLTLAFATTEDDISSMTVPRTRRSRKGRGLQRSVSRSLSPPPSSFLPMTTQSNSTLRRSSSSDGLISLSTQQ